MNPWISLRRFSGDSVTHCHYMQIRHSEFQQNPTVNVKHGSVHRNSTLKKIQPDATVCRYLFTAKPLYMFRVSQHPSSGVLKTVTATSGKGHNIGTATSLQRGLYRRLRLQFLVLLMMGAVTPEQTTLEGSGCTSIMTCTGGCSYSF